MSHLEPQSPVHKYQVATTSYQRRSTVEVKVGELLMGSMHPIRLQSMTTTDTMDTKATVAQSIRMIEAGCELVRITAPSITEAENLRLIKNELVAAGYNTPIVADIHFTPNAAEVAARIIEKVRINPGNYVDKKKFEIKEYTDHQYQAEIERIRDRFLPLVTICKEYGTAMRIGTNHGSLSDRIMNRYGDSPAGMVESAMEFLRVCVDENYLNVVLSMKSSNPQVMVQAYRLLVQQMEAENMYFPLHLGVTEAGEDKEGRIKSAIGIGTLLEDGLGDTIRVSLTEDPEFEIPVAKALADRYLQRLNDPVIIRPSIDFSKVYHPTEYDKRISYSQHIIGGNNVPRVIADLSQQSILTPYTLRQMDYHYDAVTDKWNMGEQAADFIYLGNQECYFDVPSGLRCIYDVKLWKTLPNQLYSHPLISIEDYKLELIRSEYIFISLFAEQITDDIITHLSDISYDNNSIILVLHTNAPNALQLLRYAILMLKKAEILLPVIIKRKYDEYLNEENFVLHSSIDLGGLLVDGLGDGVLLAWSGRNANALKIINQTAFYILQATRTRISKTEYISCPSCGRTLFDLQETTAMIRSKTDHLKGVKIAIMGCIVNGPGEMADADYGYVGTGTDKITLYRGKQIVKKNIDASNALSEMIELIKEDGMWVELNNN
ncbi:MAG: (E)-4-hydroxy-3-methylbut-2-enyl-diphosphate synthase [Bacteroidota bacterium]|nr:(E)-4-hydroxy-3-methylbut-2-enyl-diphosphate synthase [Bacteroidota bacterium]